MSSGIYTRDPIHRTRRADARMAERDWADGIRTKADRATAGVAYQPKTRKPATRRESLPIILSGLGLWFAGAVCGVAMTLTIAGLLR